MKLHGAPIRTLLVLLALAGGGATVQAQQQPSQSRGQLLYGTHCIACHSTQMHWRNDRLAQDWDTLKFQVRRWQGNAGLQWSDADIAEVARHLNDSIYHFPQTDGRVSLASPR
jgi:mono/diheme cytochrome c family protein